ncbi:MAG: HAMP domain-containing histidine kinase [Chloroflexia bacterium]|nr:HAMP domain-containing histidine kinase [Chloroflexia bacterium]
MSIRLRLTLLYSAIVALTLIVFAALLYVTVRQVTMSTVKDTLKADSARVQANTLEVVANGFVVRTDKFTAKTTYFQLRDREGQISGASKDAYGQHAPMGNAGMATLESGKPAFEVVSLPDSQERLLVYSVPFRPNGETIGVLQTARSLQDQDQALATLRRLLTLGTVIATLVAFGIGWLLAGAALRPINRITQTARAIGADRDFERRVAHGGPHDEVGRLATTFNAMLAQLGGAYSQVEDALRAQRRFVADASHELRTPLTSIRGNLALLRRDPPISEADRAAVLADTEEESERMSRLVHDLLQLARVDAGRPLARVTLGLGTLIDEVCRQARGIAPDRNIECDDAGSLSVLGDRDALKQVLLILLDNALKFTPRSASIRVGAVDTSDTVAIAVSDTGPGIDPAALPHIFERFYRGDAARSGTGTGLGLAIARQLVNAQGGSLEVVSHVGDGTVFTVTLPRASHPSVAEPAHPHMAGTVTPQG